MHLETHYALCIYNMHGLFIHLCHAESCIMFAEVFGIASNCILQSDMRVNEENETECCEKHVSGS